MELLHVATWLLFLCAQLYAAAYIGLGSSENTPMQDGEFEKSKVPMIRLSQHFSKFLSPTISVNTYPTDNGIDHKSGITALPRMGRKFSDILKQSKTIKSNPEGNELDASSDPGSYKVELKEEEDGERRKEFLFPNEGSCIVDRQKILNSEEIFQNECGTLQCINSEVTWSLKALGKTLPHCEGIKSIPSMFNSYAKIKVVDDEEDSLHSKISGTTLKPTRIDIDIIDQRKKIEEASRKMIEAEKWD